MLSCFQLRYVVFFFLFKQKTAYEMRISDWSSDVCSSDLMPRRIADGRGIGRNQRGQGGAALVAETRVIGISRLATRACLHDPRNPVWLLCNAVVHARVAVLPGGDRKSTRLNSSH